jgi:hypothetical protein
VPESAPLFVQILDDPRLELTAAVIEGGDHVVVGLSEFGQLDGRLPANEELVERCIELARGCGRGLATPGLAARLLLGASGEAITAPEPGDPA